MSDQPVTDAAATDAPADETEPQQPKPTETVEFWKQKAREQEKRAKDNADAAKRLAEIEDAQKSEAERTADRIAKAEAEVASMPAKVAEALRGHLVALHEIEPDDAELFLTATDPDLLLKQVSRLLARSDERKKNGNRVPREGSTTPPVDSEDARFARELFAGA
jgi:hypothetical protein